MFDLRQNSWPTTTRQYPAQFDCLWVGQPWPSLDLQQQQQQQQLACYVVSFTDWLSELLTSFVRSKLQHSPVNYRRSGDCGGLAFWWRWSKSSDCKAQKELKHTTHLHANERCQWKMINKVMPSSVYLPQRRRLCEQVDCLCVCVFLSAFTCY